MAKKYLTKNVRRDEIFVPGKCGRVNECDEVKGFYLAAMILQPTRNLVNAPIWINSGKRSIEHNRKVGGSRSSDHLFRGESAAVDFDFRNDAANRLAFKWLVKNRIGSFGQLIAYIDTENKVQFVHVSLLTSAHPGTDDDVNRILLATYEQPRVYKPFVDSIVRP